jgi:PTH1 family peptidyl-tRNA hydrolase
MPVRIRKVAVGLGNPGSRYRHTRHNLGFLALDRYLERSRRKPEVIERGTACIYRLGDLLLAKPLTYMNRSGWAVREILEEFQLPPQGCLIIYDDYALPFGVLRARAHGGPGGHHGMESILQTLGTEEIPRLRMGIGNGAPHEDLTEYVLAEFTGEEEAKLDEFLAQAAEAIDCFFASDIDAVMNRFNG